MAYTVVMSRDRPDLVDAAGEAFRQRWPQFIFHDPIPPRYMPRVHEYFPEYDILLLDQGQVAAGGWGVPFGYDGPLDDLPEGYDAALVRAVEDHESGRTATAFSFMAAAVNPTYDKKGLAAEVLSRLLERAAAAGLGHVFAPVRPTCKHRYPLVSMAEYASWQRDDGWSIDPWIRTHQRMGGRVVGPAPNSMVIPGTVGDWEQWAAMVLPVSGEYVIPDGLNLLRVNREEDSAVYHEENLVMQHR